MLFIARSFPTIRSEVVMTEDYDLLEGFSKK